MDEQFRTFSFVDRIVAVEKGVNIQGSYTIPASVNEFPVSLMAEAVGQLAAWSAMAALDFKRRPVAGLAGKIELLGPVRPGQTLQLAAELEKADAEAVAYGGTAHANGVPVIRLEDCLGPMLPLEEFNNPTALRDRFEILCGPGAASGGFEGMPELVLDPLPGEHGQFLRACLQVPEAAPLFADHFPRRAVFPGTLLMHKNLELAAALAEEIPPPKQGGKWQIRSVSDVKLRAFILPGEILELEVRLREMSEDSATLMVTIRRDGKVIGGARGLLLPEELP